MENEIFKEINRRINCVEYLQSLGMDLKEDNSTYRTYSIDKGNNKTCLMIYKNNLNYFTDNKALLKGDVIDLCMHLEFNGDKGRAVEELKKRTGITEVTGNTRTITKAQSDLPKTVEYWQSELKKNHDLMDYIHNRNINDQTIYEQKLGYSSKRDRIMIPCIKQGKPVNFCGRINPLHKNDITEKRPSKYSKGKNSDYGAQICYGLDTLYRKTDKPLVIAEGAFDYLSFYQEGYPVLSSMGGNFSDLQKKELLKSCRSILNQDKEIILIFDNDEAGNGFTADLSFFLYNHKIPFKVATVPFEEDNLKDVSDYYQKHNELEGIINTSIKSLCYLASSFNGNEKKLENFIRSGYRKGLLSDIDLSLLFNFLINHDLYDHDWLKELKKVCTKPPSEDLISYEIRKDHQLLYDESTGFYEYLNDVWEAKTDTDILKHVREAFGKFAGGRRIQSAFTLLKVDCNEHVEFNSIELINLNNGTFNLNTGELERPKPENYMTLKVNYDYDPQAGCPVWLNFLKEVTGGDVEKIDLLQEIAGYCLFPNNKLHIATILLGEGGNGKGVFMNILQEVFGGADNKNITAIQLNQLNDEKHRIHLKNSYINIAPENSKFDRDCEDILKAITSGDYINGRNFYKGLEFFNTRTKFIFAFNNIPEFNDTTLGNERRLIFINFKEKYLAEPNENNPHEHKEDTDLVSKLKEELPGIFNWVYQGYQKLIKTNKFTVTKESKAIFAKIKEIKDTITGFLNDEEIELLNKYKDKFIYDEVYKDYQRWCNECGIKRQNILDRTVFGMKYRNEFLKRNPGWETYNYNNRRGLQFIKK